MIELRRRVEALRASDVTAPETVRRLTAQVVGLRQARDAVAQTIEHAEAALVELRTPEAPPVTRLGNRILAALAEGAVDSPDGSAGRVLCERLGWAGRTGAVYSEVEKLGDSGLVDRRRGLTWIALAPEEGEPAGEG